MTIAEVESDEVPGAAHLSIVEEDSIWWTCEEPQLQHKGVTNVLQCGQLQVGIPIKVRDNHLTQCPVHWGENIKVKYSLRRHLYWSIAFLLTFSEK